MRHPTIIQSFYWDDPKKLACVIIFRDCERGDVDAFLTILRNKVDKHQIFGVPRLIGVIKDLAKIVEADIDVYEQDTIFLNGVL